MELSPVSALYVIPFIVALILAALTWSNHFQFRNRIFSLLMFSISLCSIAEAMAFSSTSLAAVKNWLTILYLAAPNIPVLWLLVIMGQTDKAKHITRRNIGLLLVIPSIVIIMMFTNEFHHLLFRSIDLDLSGRYPMISTSRGPLFWMNVGYSYFLVFLSIALLIPKIFHTQKVYRSQAVSLVTAVIVVVLVNVISNSGVIPEKNVDIMPFAFTAAALILAWGLFRYRVIDIIPVTRERVFEHILEAVIVIDRRFRLVDYNSCARDVFSRQNLRIGQPVEEVVGSYRELLALLRSETLPQTSELFITDDEKQRHYQISLVPLVNEQTGTAGKIIIFHDITRLKQVEIELVSSLEKEKSLRESLELESRKRIDFSRTLIHELKTPLTPILSSSELLITGLENEPWASFAESINLGAENLNRRIDKLLDIAKGEIGKLQISKKPVSVPELLRDIVSEMEPLALNRNQMLFLDPPGELTVVMADEVRLRQIVQNLITNALKFTGEGGKIIVRAFRQGADAVIEVQDNGIGLSKEDQTKLFQAYERLDADERRHPGLGLGLALCKNLVELHGGNIWVYSREEEGSIFGFSIPIHLKDDIIRRN